MNTQTLRVQVPAPFGQLLIAPALPRFLFAHPGLQVTMSDARSEHWVREADAEVCIGPVADSRRIVRQIGVVHPITCASPECVERTGTPHEPGHLAPGDCIALLEPSTGQPQTWIFRRGDAEHRVSPGAPLAFACPESAITAAVHGGGYVRVLGIEAAQQVAAGLLRSVLDDWNDPALPVTLVRPPDRIARAEVATFADFVAGLLPSTTVTSCSSAGGQLARAAASPAP